MQKGIRAVLRATCRNPDFWPFGGTRVAHCFTINGFVFDFWMIRSGGFEYYFCGEIARGINTNLSILIYFRDFVANSG